MPIHWPKQKYTELREQLAEGAKRAGREGAPIEIAPSVGLFITDGNEEAVRQRAREPLAFYVGRMGRFYYEMLQRHGYEREVTDIRAAWDRRDPAGAAAAVSDAMLNDINVVGPLDACADKLEELRHYGVDVPIVSLPQGSPSDVGRILERLMR
jgi:alkanesulfonate monooxygenase SsuD/methylene tetrahydromethanopterin reductase-like flavin-dependent oxidoreductase (luciferase family)